MEKLKKFSDDLVRRPSIFVMAILCVLLMYFLFTGNMLHLGYEAYKAWFEGVIFPDDTEVTSYMCGIAYITLPILFLMLIETIFKKIRFSKKLAQNKYIKSILLTFATIYAFYAVPSAVSWSLLLALLILSSM